MKDNEDFDAVIKELTRQEDEYAIEFALFLSENIYENMYQDIDKDGRTWVSYLQEGFDNISTAKRFSIQELLEIFKKEKL